MQEKRATISSRNMHDSSRCCVMDDDGDGETEETARRRVKPRKLFNTCPAKGIGPYKHAGQDTEGGSISKHKICASRKTPSNRLFIAAQSEHASINTLGTEGEGAVTVP